ncbi:MAG: 3-hydroxyacyl-CoA dehydrogenase family protein [Candidatus Humimicrobiaceae bacterium]
MDERKIAVIGAGAMGRGIAQSFIQNGFSVILNDKDEKVLKNAFEYILRGLDKLVELEKISENQKEEFKRNLSMTSEIEDLRESFLVIEAINENFAIKEKLFNQLDNLIHKDAILATNTSTLSITKIASSTKNPQRVIGLHFFIPAEIMKLVEVIPGEKTSLYTVNKSINILNNIKKITVKCKDSPGFIVNRLILLFQNEAARLLDEKIASAEDIDNAIKLGLNHKMGPLELADFVGLDVLYNSLMILHEELGAERYKPANTLKELVGKGSLGRKTSQGFYEYKEK